MSQEWSPNTGLTILLIEGFAIKRVLSPVVQYSYKLMIHVVVLIIRYLNDCPQATSLTNVFADVTPKISKKSKSASANTTPTNSIGSQGSGTEKKKRSEVKKIKVRALYKIYKARYILFE